MDQQKIEARDPVRVLHDDLERLPNGIKDGARAIGRSPGVLYNKFSEEMPQYAINVREGEALARFVLDRLGSYAYVEATCERFDGVFVPMPPGEAADDDILSAHLEVVTQLGQLSAELTEVRRDGLITRDEFGALKVRTLRGVRALYSLLREIESQVVEPNEVAAHGMKVVR